MNGSINALDALPIARRIRPSLALRARRTRSLTACSAALATVARENPASRKICSRASLGSTSCDGALRRAECWDIESSYSSTPTVTDSYGRHPIDSGGPDEQTPSPRIGGWWWNVAVPHLTCLRTRPACGLTGATWFVGEIGAHSCDNDDDESGAATAAVRLDCLRQIRRLRSCEGTGQLLRCGSAVLLFAPPQLLVPTAVSPWHPDPREASESLPQPLSDGRRRRNAKEGRPNKKALFGDAFFGTVDIVAADQTP
jgi:hypothetical protein